MGDWFAEGSGAAVRRWLDHARASLSREELVTAESAAARMGRPGEEIRSLALAGWMEHDGGEGADLHVRPILLGVPRVGTGE